MLRFTEYNEIKNYIEGLLEANIQEPRYKAGDMVILKDNKITTFNNQSPFKASKNTIFVKTKKIQTKDEFPKVIEIGDGEPLVTLNVFDDMSKVKSGSITAVVTWRQNPDTYYNHLKLGDEINWGGSTTTLETAQCIGVFYDGEGDISTLAGKQKIIKKITSILGNGADWNSKGKSYLLSKLPTLIDKDWIVLLSLIKGMNEFIQAVVPFSSPKIIHGRIDDYYRSEEDNEQVEVKGIKDNTADMIVCSSSAGELIKAMKIEKVTHDARGICETDISKIQFVQVSLKKSEEGAQLGKATGSILQKYGVKSYMEIYREVTEEQYHPDYVQYLDEGFGDFIKKSWSKLKNTAKSLVDGFKKLVAGAKKLFRGWVGSMRKVFAQETTSAIKEFSQRFKLNPKDVKSLTESFNTFAETGQIILNEADEASINVTLKKQSVVEIKKFVNSIEDRKSSMVALYDQHDYLDHLIEKPGIKVPQPKQFDINVSIKLLANEVSLRTLNKIFRANASNMTQLVADMVDIQREIYFGKTTLPLYKVYGKDVDSQSTPYKYLKTASEFSKEKTAQIGGKDNDFAYPISGFSMTSQGLYYNVESWIITGVKEARATYAQMRMGTNKAGAFSYVVEGTNEKTQDQYETKFKKK